MICTCCHGKRVVPDIEGNMRPCSRCNLAAFDRWAAARRPKREVIVEIKDRKETR